MPDARVACAALLAAYLLNNVALLSFASLVEKRALAFGDERSLRFTPGLTEGTETMLAYTAFCLLPEPRRRSWPGCSPPWCWSPSASACGWRSGPCAEAAGPAPGSATGASRGQVEADLAADARRAVPGATCATSRSSPRRRASRTCVPA